MRRKPHPKYRVGQEITAQWAGGHTSNHIVTDIEMTEHGYWYSFLDSEGHKSGLHECYLWPATYKKRTFRIPVEWTSCGFVQIEASTLEEAVRIFDGSINDIDLPEDASYIDSSFQRATQGTNNPEDDMEYYGYFNLQQGERK